MASDFEKPNKVHTLFSNEVEEKMFPLKVDDLFMIGKASSKKLHEMGINTIEELANYDVDMLTRKFKSMGKMMHDYANGIDNSPVYYEREAAKSISSSTVLPYNYHDISMIHDVIHNLSCDIGKKLRYNKMYADTIGIWLKYNYFDKVSKQVKWILVSQLMKKYMIMLAEYLIIYGIMMMVLEVFAYLLVAFLQ